MTVLVTGAAGFIGFSVSERLLARGETPTESTAPPDDSTDTTVAP